MNIFKRLFGSKKSENDDSENKNSGGTSLKEFDKDKIFFNFEDFIHKEAIYRSQPIILRRSFENNRITLGEVLHELLNLKRNEMQSLSIIERKLLSSDINPVVVTDIESIYNFDLFGCILKNKSDGYYTLGMSNEATLIVTTSSNRIFLSLYSIGGSLSIKYIRVSILIPNDDEQDDLRSSQSKSFPKVFSFVLPFAENCYEQSLTLFETIEKQIDNKFKNGEEFDEIEQEYLNGLSEFRGAYYIGYGKWLYEEGRYYDSYEILHRAYNFLKSRIHNVDQDATNIFYEICDFIGNCLSKLHREEEAIYYYYLASDSGKIKNLQNYISSLARLGDATAQLYSIREMTARFISEYGENKAQWPKDAADFDANITIELAKYKKQSDSLIEHNAHVNGIITIGSFLKLLFGTDKRNLLPSMAVFDNSNKRFEDKINDCDKIFNYILNEDTCFNKSYILSISHHGEFTQNKDDKSILCLCACMVITTHQVKTEDSEKLMRIDVVRANFPNNDDKRELTEANTPLHKSLILGVHSENTFGTSIDECIKCFHYAEVLKQQKRVLEAEKFYNWTFKNIRNLIKSNIGILYKTDDIEMTNLLFESAYYVGFCHMELELFDSAFFYLEFASRSNDAQHNQEYINCLVNSKSPIALRVIDDVINRSKNPNTDDTRPIWDFHIAFLKRRKAYVLIDMQKYDEAELFLKEIVNDPLCKDFAEGELNYIHNLDR